ncbi:hypothetical protein ACWDTP_34220 [Mycobacterium sp. NPDC003449]
MTDWRDHTDQLTADQLHSMETMATNPAATPDRLERAARRYAAQNVILAEFLDSWDGPNPAGATEVDRWSLEHDGVAPLRRFFGTAWTIPAHRDDDLGWATGSAEMLVEINGVQREDGIKREIHLSIGGIDGEFLDLGTARLLAEALTAAVNEAEADAARERYAPTTPVFSDAAETS